MSIVKAEIELETVWLTMIKSINIRDKILKLSIDLNIYI